VGNYFLITVSSSRNRVSDRLCLPDESTRRKLGDYDWLMIVAWIGVLLASIGASATLILLGLRIVI
jgi:hypothetical protein